LAQISGIKFCLAHTKSTWMPAVYINGDENPATLQQACRPRSIMPFFR
jgi:hypothetical protein